MLMGQKRRAGDGLHDLLQGYSIVDNAGVASGAVQKKDATGNN